MSQARCGSIVAGDIHWTPACWLAASSSCNVISTVSIKMSPALVDTVNECKHKSYLTHLRPASQKASRLT